MTDAIKIDVSKDAISPAASEMIARRAQEVADAWPPLTPEQKAKLRAIIHAPQ